MFRRVSLIRLTALIKSKVLFLKSNLFEALQFIPSSYKFEQVIFQFSHDPSGGRFLRQDY